MSNISLTSSPKKINIISVIYCNLIDGVPLSAHKNNYLLKLIILLNKTGRLPGPANFPIKLQCCHFVMLHLSNSGYLSLLYGMSSFLNIAEIRIKKLLSDHSSWQCMTSILI